jgi:hypothetical protein
MIRNICNSLKITTSSSTPFGLILSTHKADNERQILLNTSLLEASTNIHFVFMHYVNKFIMTSLQPMQISNYNSESIHENHAQIIIENYTSIVYHVICDSFSSICEIVTALDFSVITNAHFQVSFRYSLCVHL